jgi:hypothetical protein
MFPESFDPMVIMDIAIDGFLAVFGFECDFRGKIPFEIEGDNFPFVGDST